MAWGRVDGWLLVAAALSVFLLLTAGSFRRIWEADFWWQLRTGQYVAESGIPRVDVFSYTSQGKPWVELRWLFDLVLYETVRLAGYGGAIVLKWVAALLAFGLATGAALRLAAKDVDGERQSSQGTVGGRPPEVVGGRKPRAGEPPAPTSPAAEHPAASAVPRGFPILSAVLGPRPSIPPLGRTAMVACGVLLIAILASSQRFFVRPELATYVFLTAFMLVIAVFRTHDSHRASHRILYVLPVLQLLWVNTHSLFILGPGLVGLLLAVEAVEGMEARADRGPAPDTPSEVSTLRGSRLRTVGIVLAATIAVCALNPYGLKGLSVPLQLFSELHNPVFKGLIGELQSPFSFAQSYTAVAYFEVLIGLCIASALINLRRLDPFWTLLAASQLYLSVTSIRNLPLFALASVPFIVLNAHRSSLAARPSLTRWVARARRLMAVGIVVVAALYARDLVTDRFNVRQNDTNQFGVGLATHRFPETTARLLRERVAPVNLLNSMFEGSYLLAHGVKVFIDPRLEVHGRKLLERYVLMQNDRGAWDDAVHQFDLRSALVDLQSPFIRQMTARGDWSLVDFDEVAAVFVRSGVTGAPAPITTPQDYAQAIARLRGGLPAPRPYDQVSWLGRIDSPAPYLRVAYFLMSFGQREAAEPFASDALTAYPKAQGAHMVLAQIREGRGDIANAAREYEAELEIDPGSLLAQRGLATCAFKLGRFEDARKVLERYVQAVPTDPLAWGMLTRAHAEGGRAAEALRCAERAVKLAPKNPDFRKNLGLLYAVTGNERGAIAALERAVKLDPGDAATHRDLARMLLKPGRRAEALASIERALALRPGDAESLELKRVIQERP